MELKKKYEELQKKYQLPSYDELDSDFEISLIEDEKFLLRKIRRKIKEKLESYTQIIESILMPESNLTTLYEVQIFREEEKREMYLLFKQIMYLDRLAIETSINEDDKKTSEFINEFWEKWASIKTKFFEIIKKLKEGWTKEIKSKEERNYLG